MVATWSTRQTDGLVTDGEALSIPRSINCWKVQWERTLSLSDVLGLPKGSNRISQGSNWSPSTPRSMHPAPFGQFTFLAQILPPLFAVMAKQMLDPKSKASSCFHYFMALSAPTSCFPFSSPPPPGRERPSPLALGPDPYVSAQVPLFFCGWWVAETGLVPWGRGLDS